MIKQWAFLCWICLFLNACSYTSEETLNRARLNITIEIIPEEENSYSVIWKDSIGRKEEYGLTNRPIELWCHVKNSQDNIIGIYRGKSTPSNFVVFQTEEPVIKLDFSKGINYFSNLFRDEALLQTYLKDGRNFTEFQTLAINLEECLKKETFLQLKQR